MLNWQSTISSLYYSQENTKYYSLYLMYLKQKKQVVEKIINAGRYWQDSIFLQEIVWGTSECILPSMGYPLYVSNIKHRDQGRILNVRVRLFIFSALTFDVLNCRQRTKEAATYTTLVQGKALRLLTWPNWKSDKINIPHRFRQPSLLKDFVEIQ